MAGLYIHFPYCLKKCAYCDFYSEILCKDNVTDYFQALFKELELYSQKSLFSESLETIYIGGGTPSLIDISYLTQLINNIHHSFQVVQNSEISLEVNPGTFAGENIRDWRERGINRLSIGAQSFYNQELKMMGRIHDAKDIENTFLKAKDAGFENIGLDLIFGLPGQSLEAWRQSLEVSLDLQPQHLSLYALSWSEETVLGRQIISGVLPQPDEACVSDQFLMSHEILERAGYIHYEISNYALPGYESRHNEGYWTGVPYLGLGPSAHSFINDKRFWNVADVQSYIQFLDENKFPIEGEETLSREQLVMEKTALGLRRRQGINLKDFSSPALIEELVKRGLAECFDSTIRLTPEGFLLADEVALKAI